MSRHRTRSISNLSGRNLGFFQSQVWVPHGISLGVGQLVREYYMHTMHIFTFEMKLFKSLVYRRQILWLFQRLK